MTNLKSLIDELNNKTNPSKAMILSGFFKTGKGDYGEGDIFLGLTVPEQRSLAKKYIDISLDDIQVLLKSKIHEHRLTGLIILTYQYEKEASKEKKDERKKESGEKIKKEKKSKEIFDFYIRNADNINNWDLVDVTCPRIIGAHLIERPLKERKVLYKFARSKNLWKKRIAIVSTFTLIRNNDFEDTLKISEILMHDRHDLIHKAVGWMLREVGKKNEKKEKEFLEKNANHMPRTMLRYAIEKFSEQDRKYYLSRKNL